jgi:hypothetical protein
MSVFRMASVWTLRALVLWGALELGAQAYDVAVARWSEWSMLAGHRAAMARLDERARATETRALAAEAALASARGAPWRVITRTGETPATAAALELRQMLIELGAEAPVVDGATDGASNDRITLTTRWRERADTSPAVLRGLAARRPELQLASLSMDRQDQIVVEAVFIAHVRAEPGAAP